MTTTQTPPADTAAPEPGYFNRLSLTASLVIDPRDEPLPRVYLGGTGDNIPTIAFASEYGPEFKVHIQSAADAHSQAAYLYALGASLTALAREVEGR